MARFLITKTFKGYDESYQITVHRIMRKRIKSECGYRCKYEEIKQTEKYLIYLANNPQRSLKLTDLQIKEISNKLDLNKYHIDRIDTW